MSVDRWREEARANNGTTIFDATTMGWRTVRIWWSPDKVIEPSITSIADKEDPTPVEIERYASGWDRETAELVARQFHIEQGRPMLVEIGDVDRLKARLLEVVGPHGFIEVQSWRAIDALRPSANANAQASEQAEA